MSKPKTALAYLWSPFANLLWYVYTVVMATVSLALLPLDRDGTLQHRCARLWCGLILFTTRTRVRVYGLENIRPDQNYVYMANHASLIDIPALFVALPYKFRILAKKELFYVPFLGWHLWAAGHFKVDRGNPRRTARSLRRVIEGVRAGNSIVLFPEGTRSDDGMLREFKPGAFKIAMSADVPIIPVALCGTQDVLPNGSLAPRPGTVNVIIGPPIDPKQYSERHLGQLIGRTRNSIASALARGMEKDERRAGRVAPSAGL